MSREHGLTLLESEMDEIKRIVDAEPDENALVGHCVRMGTDEEGHPRIVVTATKHEIMKSGRFLYNDVEVRLRPLP